MVGGSVVGMQSDVRGGGQDATRRLHAGHERRREGRAGRLRVSPRQQAYYTSRLQSAALPRHLAHI